MRKANTEIKTVERDTKPYVTIEGAYTRSYHVVIKDPQVRLYYADGYVGCFRSLEKAKREGQKALDKYIAAKAHQNYRAEIH